MRKFILNNQYLLLAFMVLVIVFGPFFLHDCKSPSNGPNASPGPSASSMRGDRKEDQSAAPIRMAKHFVVPGSLEEKYQKIDMWMSEQQVRDILGPPDEIEPVSDSDLWIWRQSGDTIYLLMNGRVFLRQFSPKK